MACDLLWFNKFLFMYKTPETTTTTASSEVANNQDHLKITNGFNHKKTHAKKHQYLQVLVAAILIGKILSYGFITSVATKSPKYFGPTESENTILIKALLPLTSTLSSFGQSAKTSLKLAVDDVNNQFANSG